MHLFTIDSAVIEGMHERLLLKGRGTTALEKPEKPVYCIYPHVYEKSTQHFINGFSGRTLYAVKANNHPEVMRQIYAAGVRHFDCASFVEVELASELCPDSTIYYMNPVRLKNHARASAGKIWRAAFCC